jgi:hypothetical protein
MVPGAETLARALDDEGRRQSVSAAEYEGVKALVTLRAQCDKVAVEFSSAPLIRPVMRMEFARRVAELTAPPGSRLRSLGSLLPLRRPEVVLVRDRRETGPSGGSGGFVKLPHKIALRALPGKQIVVIEQVVVIEDVQPVVKLPREVHVVDRQSGVGDRPRRHDVKGIDDPGGADCQTLSASRLRARPERETLGPLLDVGAAPERSAGKTSGWRGEVLPARPAPSRIDSHAVRGGDLGQTDQLFASSSHEPDFTEIGRRHLPYPVESLYTFPSDEEAKNDG